MKCSTIIYHGTTAPNIQNFVLGVNTTGETDDPINGIWFSTLYSGAYWHATNIAGRIRKAKNSYVYQCALDKNTTIADAKRSRLPPHIFKKLVDEYFPWHLRLAYYASMWSRNRYTQNSQWFRYVDRFASKNGRMTGHVARHNARIEICLKIGIDVLVHPSTTLYGSGLAHWDETAFGETVLLLNMNKCKPVVQFRFSK